MPQGKDLVLETQLMLTERDYDPGPTDGIMGEKTAAAIRAFQTDNSLEPTGEVNRATYSSLKPSLKTSSEVQDPSIAAAIGSQFVGILFGKLGVKAPSKSTTEGGSVAEQEAAKKKELSRNHASVNFQVSCPDLYIPEVYEKKHRNVIPVYAMVVLNNSTKRYSVQYDLVYEEGAEAIGAKRVFGTTVAGREGYAATMTQTKNFTVRPDTFTEFLLIEKNKGSGTQIKRIAAVDVFKCTSP
jgi:peptidoglycan hydrolase-like protein with peptidoglycan-binding domain